MSLTSSSPSVESIHRAPNHRAVNEIKRNIVKQGKQWAISRALHSKKNKKAIVSWRLSLNIMCVLSVGSLLLYAGRWSADFLQSEFGSGEPAFTPGPRHEAAERSAIRITKESSISYLHPVYPENFRHHYPRRSLGGTSWSRTSLISQTLSTPLQSL